MSETTRFDELAGGEQHGVELLQGGEQQQDVDTLGGEEHGPDTLGGPEEGEQLLRGGEQKSPETISVP
jgi:hypothetical protein